MQNENASKNCKKLHFLESENGKKPWFSSENEIANTTARNGQWLVVVGMTRPARGHKESAGF
jgi:hypothetical protein